MIIVIVQLPIPPRAPHGILMRNTLILIGQIRTNEDSAHTGVLARAVRHLVQDRTDERTGSRSGDSIGARRLSIPNLVPQKGGLALVVAWESSDGVARTRHCERFPPA
jgi:hypothetical protein